MKESCKNTQNSDHKMKFLVWTLSIFGTVNPEVSQVAIKLQDIVVCDPNDQIPVQKN